MNPRTRYLYLLFVPFLFLFLSQTLASDCEQIPNDECYQLRMAIHNLLERDAGLSLYARRKFSGFRGACSSCQQIAEILQDEGCTVEHHPNTQGYDWAVNCPENAGASRRNVGNSVNALDELLHQNANVIVGRSPSQQDGVPDQRHAPIARLSHQMSGERSRWQWVQVVNTDAGHWQHDVIIDDGNLSIRIHGNSNRHQLQLGEPTIIERPDGTFGLVMYIGQDHVGDNPILQFDIAVDGSGRVQKLASKLVRGAGLVGTLAYDLVQLGVSLGLDDTLDWATGGIASAQSQVWQMLQAVTPDDWLHQHDGWQMDAIWFAMQAADLYARQLRARHH